MSKINTNTSSIWVFFLRSNWQCQHWKLKIRLLFCFDSTEHCFTYNLSETQKVAEDYSKSTWLSLYPGTSRSKRTLKSICFIRCEAAAAADQHFSCFAVELGSCLAGTGLFSFWSLGCSPWGDLLSTLSLPESPPQKDGDLPPSRTLGEGHALSTPLLRLSWS